MTILNARYIMDPNEDPNAHVEIVYVDKVLYAGGSGDNGWDDLQEWITEGNTIIEYSIPIISTPTWVDEVRQNQ